MVSRLFKIIYLILSICFIAYLAIPEPSFPGDLPNSIRSQEPADLESPDRIGFFTDLTRAEVISFYKNEFEKSSMGIPLPMLRLNYPPEEAQTLIRDQTASNFLEELTHPARESLFVNGYETPEGKNPLVVEGRTWRQKVIIKYVHSQMLIRVALGVFGLALLAILIFESKQALLEIKRIFIR